MIDFRKINKATIGDACPLPRIEKNIRSIRVQSQEFFEEINIISTTLMAEYWSDDSRCRVFTSVQFIHFYILQMINDIVIYVKYITISFILRSIENHNLKLCKVFDKLCEYNL